MISIKRFREFLRVAFGPKVSWRDYLEILKSAFHIARSPYSQEMWRGSYACVLQVPYIRQGA